MIILVQVGGFNSEHFKVLRRFLSKILSNIISRSLSLSSGPHCVNC